MKKVYFLYVYTGFHSEKVVKGANPNLRLSRGEGNIYMWSLG